MADPRIPGLGAFTPEQEQNFQTFMAFNPNVRAWQNGFQNRYGEMPNTANDPTFSYRQAWQAGNVPQPYAGDNGFYHWDSRGKAADHPTEWMNDFMQQQLPSADQYMQPQIPKGGLF